jgi:hypothetical protein
MSDIPPKADVAKGCCHVCFVPKADIRRSFVHQLVGPRFAEGFAFPPFQKNVGASLRLFCDLTYTCKNCGATTTRIIKIEK